MVGRHVADLTSGMRAVSASKFKEILYLLPNGFSYPTTSTMAFFRSGYQVGFVPIQVLQRTSSTGSHINLYRDGVRFLLIIFKIGALYSPVKIFFPTSLLFLISGLSYFAFTLLTDGRFTNFGALLLTTSVLVFLIGLVSEQITNLMFLPTNRKDDNER